MTSKTILLTKDIWRSITATAKHCRKPSFVAAAYFGKGASKLLPLRTNSRLVVDASEAAVKSGVTHPADLRIMQKRGVIVYSVPNLHAKVYAFDDFAFVGSANVSNHSAGTLVEAMIRTSDRSAIRSVRAFVQGLCSNELSPGTIDRLQKLYRPPRVVGGVLQIHGQKIKKAPRAVLPRLFLTHLVHEDPPVGSEGAEEKGRQIAQSRRKHSRRYVLDDFHYWGRAPFRTGDKVIQVVEEGGGRRLIDAPGTVLSTRRWDRKGRRVTFVFLERPEVRRIGLEKLARQIGYGAKKKLSRNGLVRNQEFAEILLAEW
ncbi:phospholipase D family protein [Bradyrhizobium elkanii]|uniref:phospholipase D family protein n=1 Tax=Bradyrhizobium elkanii TaxID=29448 RepID=UPI00272C8ABD|nr:phospholipase D family protein [Bradyrhizobium elkanii]WLA81957.1 phospholipase D family protein [Bradyrhizobium elkanii]